MAARRRLAQLGMRKVATLAAVLGLGVTGLFLLEQVPTASAATKAPLSVGAAGAITNAQTSAGGLTPGGAGSMSKGIFPIVNNGSSNTGSPSTPGGGGTVSPKQTTGGGTQFCTVTFTAFPGLDLTIGTLHIVVPPIVLTLQVPCFISGIFH